MVKMSDENYEREKLISIIDGLELELKIKEEELKERDNIIKELKSKIKELNHKIFEFETKIDIFQNQITPSVAESIKRYRNTIADFESLLNNKNKIIQALNKNYLQLKEENKELMLKLNKKENLIEQLNKKIDYVPIICDKLNNEIKKRDLKKQALNQEITQLKQELSILLKAKDLQEFNEFQDKIQNLLNMINNKNKTINFLKEQITKQKNVISKLKELDKSSIIKTE